MTIDTAHDAPPAWTVDLAGSAATTENRGPQDQLLRPVAGDGLCDASGLSAGRVRMPPGAQAVPHHHAEDRTVVVLAGFAATLLAPPGGTRWSAAAVTGPEDVVFIPGGWIHQAVNLGGVECRAVEISADRVFNRSVHRLPDFDGDDVAALLRADYEAGRVGLGALPL
ncbi:hypothetical protein [Amycolatopsis sp. VC5-11]|uniref:hypothetical protein n=1 Tax=Amycolatopsis sp. VC5-11 TaxID=3120156 RepID=UPI003008BBAE